MTAPASAAKMLHEATGDRRFDELGETLKSSITYEEWMWLSDGEKARFVASCTEPESFNDGV